MRPIELTEALTDAICDLLMDGMSMRKIAEREDMPSRATMLRWLASNETFEAKCARARVFQADLMDDKILETADACTNETAQADKVKISAYQWRASKLNPKKYGDSVQMKHSGSDGGAVPVRFESLTDAQLAAFIGRVDAAVGAREREGGTGEAPPAED